MLTTITVDVGTTSIKLGVFGESGRCLNSHRVRTPTAKDAWGDIYEVDRLVGTVTRFIASLSSETRDSVGRVAVTGVGESGGLVRTDGTLASPLILWHDHRGLPYLERLTAAEKSELCTITGLPTSPNYSLSKVAWAIERTGAGSDAVWLNVAEYLAALMTGERWAEPSLASRTMALELETGRWSARACELFGLTTASFPSLRVAAAGVPLSETFASRVGLSTSVRVHVAGHDHMVGGIGAGLARGELLNSTGTTEGLLFLTDHPSRDERCETTRLAGGIAPAGDDYTLFASIPTGGSAFETLQSLLGLSASDLTRRVETLTERYLAGKSDLESLPLVLPQFRGAPPPTKNSAARGVISGIGSAVTDDDIILGCFVGMARQFAEVLDLFDITPDRIKVIGPASGNPLWLHLKADLLGRSLSVSRADEVVSRGAQALASDARLEWAACDPFEVDADEDRHRRLAEWRAATAERWEHLKATPW